ncbi:hypothetical protein Tco_0361018, partial [Tanacetum coccineum]
RRIFKKRNKKKAKSKQIQAREGKNQVKSKSKVIKMKKIQLEGTKAAYFPKSLLSRPTNPVTTGSSTNSATSTNSKLVLSVKTVSTGGPF